MVSFDGCDLCEVVGLYILHRHRMGQKQKLIEIDFGQYHNDGLGVVKSTPKTNLERVKKELHVRYMVYTFFQRRNLNSP